jgi:HK97 family phage portal protein
VRPAGLRAKAAEIYRGLFDFSAGTIQRGFYPGAVGGQAAPPINVVGSQSGQDISPGSMLAVSAAWACTWLIADTISTLPFILNQRDGHNSYGAPAFENPLYTVLGQRPNTYMPSAEFWQYLVASELLWGSGYAEKTLNGKSDVISLQPLLSQWMTPYKLPSGELRYRYQPGFASEPLEDYSQAQIFHIKDRTLDGITGLSRIQYGRNSMGIAQAAEKATGDTFRNGMRIGGLITNTKTLNPEQRKEIKASLVEFRTGGPQAAGFMVGEAGMGFEPISMSPQDAQLLASRQFSVEDVCRWFGVPPVLIGHGAPGVTTWGTGVEQLLIGFVSLTLRPYVRKLEQSVQFSLLKPSDRTTVYLTIDTDDLMGADSTARAALYSTYAQNGIMSRNEIRAKEDLAPKAGGDALTVQSNLVPIEKLGQAPAATDKPLKPVEKPQDDTQLPLSSAEKALKKSVKRELRMASRQNERAAFAQEVAAALKTQILGAMEHERDRTEIRNVFQIGDGQKTGSRKFKRLQITE